MKDRGIWNEQNIISDRHFTVSQEVVLFLVSQQQFGPLRQAVRHQCKRHWRYEHSGKLPEFKHLNRVFFKISLSEKNFASSSFVASRTYVSRNKFTTVLSFLRLFPRFVPIGSLCPSVRPPAWPASASSGAGVCSFSYCPLLLDPTFQFPATMCLCLAIGKLI